MATSLTLIAIAGAFALYSAAAPAAAQLFGPKGPETFEAQLQKLEDRAFLLRRLYLTGRSFDAIAGGMGDLQCDGEGETQIAACRGACVAMVEASDLVSAGYVCEPTEQGCACAQ